jgi:mercuric ion transport protein
MTDLSRAAIRSTVEPQDNAGLQRRQKLMAVGGLLGALAASSCCILPLVLFSLGVSGAWIGNFTQLAPYQPYFIAATIACLGYGYWLVYRASKVVCADGEACARPMPNRLVRFGLILATVLVVAAIGFNLLAPLFLNA